MAMIAKKKYVSLKKSDSESSKLKPLTPESKELKPLLKRISPAEALAQKGLKTLKPAPKELKPLIPKKKVFKSLKKTGDVDNDGAQYVPTHFRETDLKKEAFNEVDEKYNSLAENKELKGKFEMLRRRLGRKNIDIDNERAMFVASAPSGEFYSYFNLANSLESKYIPPKAVLNRNSIVPKKITTGIIEDEITPHFYPKLNPTVPFYKAFHGKWESGFVGDTYLLYAVDSPNSRGSGYFEFVDGEKTILVPVEYRSYPALNILPIAERQGEFRWHMGVIERYDAFFYFNDDFIFHDLFNNIRFRSENSEDKLRYAFVKLNGQVVCNTTEMMNEGRYSLEENRIKNGTDLAEAIYWTKQSQLDYPESEVLKCAVNELGRAWCYKWHSKWRNNWCSEFVSWVLRNSTTLKDVPQPNPPFGDNVSSEDMLRYFIPRYQFISSETQRSSKGGKYFYNELGAVVKPGFYASIFNGKHSCIFVKWNGLFEHNGENTFTAIGGNQNGTVNIIDNRTIVDRYAQSSEPDEDIFWKGNITNDNSLEIKMPDGIYKIYTMYDGFGNTKNKMEASLTPKTINNIIKMVHPVKASF